MIDIIRAGSRGHTKTAWLDSRHSFSFGNYQDPDREGFGVLRVLNEDKVAPGKGFEMHEHENMEIVTIVLKGVLEHQDTLGNEGLVRENEVQRMSAGKGIMHSEMNASKTDEVHFLQLWIEPNQRNLKPTYEQSAFTFDPGVLVPIVTWRGERAAVEIHQKCNIFMSVLEKGQDVRFELSGPDRGMYVFVIEGSFKFAGEILKRGDAAAVADEEQVKTLSAMENGKVILVDVGLENRIVQ